MWETVVSYATGGIDTLRWVKVRNELVKVEGLVYAKF